MADLIGALVQALKDDPDTAALAGQGVYGAELPRDAVMRMPIGAIVVQASGGVPLTEGSDADAVAQRIDLIAYGASPFEAEQLRRTGSRALRSIRRRIIAGTLIHWVNSAGGFSAGRDRDGHWPQAFQSFQIFYAEGEE